MNRPVFLTLLLFAAFLQVKAQLLWQISGNSVEGKSYLLATDLLTDATIFDSVPNVFRLFNAADNIITEMTYTDSLLQQAILQNALLPDSLSLKKIYSNSEYAEISQAVQQYLQIPITQIERLKPVYINELIRQQLLREWADYNPDRSSDNFFQSLCLQTGKTLTGLDNTGETIFMLFEREPIEWQKTELLRTVRSPEKEIKQQKTISAFYRNGKLNEIAYQVSMPDNQTSISYSDYKTYCDRNREWVKKLTPMLKQGGQFIVLNSIYLGGDDGLIAQLRKSGYKVKAVNR